MTDAHDTDVPDLTGSVDDRIAQLKALDAETLSASWLHRQLTAALAAWADDDTELDIERESRSDF